MTLKRTSRSMPAMPMAERRPPIVVGMRQTSSAIKTVADRTVPEYLAIGHRADADDQEDDGQPGQQNRQRQFVRRLLPLGALDQRDHPVDEGRARRGGDPHLDEVGQHGRSAGDGRAIAAGLANDGRGLAGDRRFIDGGDALDDVAVAGNDLAGFDQHDIAQTKVERIHAFDDAAKVFGIDIALGAGVAARAPQSVGLRLAAPFGDRLGEIGEQHREPQPGGDLAREGSRPVMSHKIANEEQGHHQRHHFGDEDDGVLRQRSRVELAQRVDRRAGDDLAVEQALRLGFRRHVDLRSEGLAVEHQEVLDDRRQRQRREILQEVENHDDADQRDRRTAARRSGRCRPRPESSSSPRAIRPTPTRE